MTNIIFELAKSLKRRDDKLHLRCVDGIITLKGDRIYFRGTEKEIEEQIIEKLRGCSED